MSIKAFEATEGEGERRSVVPHIRGLMPSLAPSDARVARVISENPAGVIHLSVAEIAERAGVAGSTVIRASQRMGFRGFQHLKISLAQETGYPERRPEDESVSPKDSPGRILGKVMRSGARALEDALSTVDERAFEGAVETLAKARQCLFVGVGTSAPPAQDAAYRFLTIGVSAYGPPDIHTQHVAARLLGNTDACLAFSHTGATRETITALKGAKEAGAKTLVITSFSRSPITEFADLVLVAGGPEQSFRMEAMTSRIAHLSVLDALFVAVAMRIKRRANPALDITADVLGEHRY